MKKFRVISSCNLTHPMVATATTLCARPVFGIYAKYAGRFALSRRGIQFFTRKGSSRSRKPPVSRNRELTDKYLHYNPLKMVYPTIHDGEIEVIFSVYYYTVIMYAIYFDFAAFALSPWRIFGAGWFCGTSWIFYIVLW